MKKFYIARDMDGELSLYEGTCPPTKGNTRWITSLFCDRITILHEEESPSVTWEDKTPLQVMICPCSSTLPKIRFNEV